MAYYIVIAIMAKIAENGFSYRSCFSSFKGSMEINSEQFNPSADLAGVESPEVLLTLLVFNRFAAMGQRVRRV